MPRLRLFYKLIRLLLPIAFAAAITFPRNISSISAQGINQAEGVQLRLRVAEFDPINELPEAALRLSPPVPDLDADQNRLWIVQFAGPIQDGWITTASENGLEILTYIPDYAYLVWGDRASVELTSRRAPVRWWGEYLPGYALHPDLVSEAIPLSTVRVQNEKPVPAVVDVQLANRPELASVVMDIIRSAEWVSTLPYSVLEFQNLTIAIAPEKLVWLASQPGVVDVAPHLEMTLLDEVQGQILAGNLDASGRHPAGPGYLSWLIQQGFVNEPERYPIIDITDDGLDDGDDGIDDCEDGVIECDDGPTHRDFYLSGNKALSDRIEYNVNLTEDALADGRGGHGTINASIAGGFSQGGGAIHLDPNGYQRGLGINPFGRLSATKVFSNAGFYCTNCSGGDLIRGSYLRGARISSNSWGASTFGSYGQYDQEYDSLVRDAVGDLPGNQEMTILFAAGNDGGMGNSITSPGNAKNVITVGASESDRAVFENFSADICSNTPGDADNPEQIADFSSRGPADDGRVKPDLVAPGTMILGAASQTAGYKGDGVCISHYPSGQQMYAASSGTSHSTPAAAGAASLLDYYYREHFGGESPSPAMVKAYLINSARYLSDEGEILPSNHQGFGRIDLGRAFNETPRWLSDQRWVLEATGEVYEARGEIYSAQEGLRITLGWTDAPGSPVSGVAYVNNLDLEVEYNGQTYRGNRFSGAVTQAGGSADYRNNVESVILPAGGGGAFTVRVKAANLAGDGIPGNSDATDQDFALVVYNAVNQAGVIQGKVKIGGGSAPAANALVWAVSDGNRLVETKADENGEYQLKLFAGNYTLNAWKEGYSHAFVNGLTLNYNEVITQDLSLAQQVVHSLSGCVRDRATSLGLAARVEIIGPLNTIVATQSTTRSVPCYQASIPAGSYSVRATSRLHDPETTIVSLENSMTVNFSLGASTDDGLFTGRVVDRLSGLPIAQAVVAILETGDEYRTGGDGSFEFQLPAGSYHVSATALFREAEAASILVPQSNIESRDFELKSAQLTITAPNSGTRQITAAQEIKVDIQLENLGEAPLAFEVYEREHIRIPGGRDNAGYIWMDNRAPGEVIYGWPQATNETRLYLEDDAVAQIGLPFAFKFYGKTYTTLRVGNNGAAGFGADSGGIPFYNTRLSDIQQPLLAPFWDDLDDDFGYVSYRVEGTAPNRRFVVAWNQRPHYNNVGEASFAAVLYEQSGSIKFLYADVIFGNNNLDRGQSATVGIRGEGSDYLEYSFNQAALANGLAVCFQPPGAAPCDRVELSWVKAAPQSGILAVGKSTTLTAALQALPGTPYGYLTGGLRIYSNDPLRQPFVDIPLAVYHAPPPVYLPFLQR